LANAVTYVIAFIIDSSNLFYTLSVLFYYWQAGKNGYETIRCY